MREYRNALICAAAVGASAAGGAETFRCQRADGTISFQQAPCPLAELATPERPAAARRPETTAGPRSAPPPEVPPVAGTTIATVPQPVAPRTRSWTSVGGADEPYTLLTRRKREVLDLTARFERCRADQPGFAATSAQLYQAWRRRHEATLSSYERLLALKVGEVRRSGSMPLSLCNDEWLRSIEPLARAPDPRFSTVEKTWAVFVGALLAADRATLLNCVTGTAAARLKERIGRIADADLRRMGAAIRGLKMQWGDDYEKEGLVAHDGRVDGIAFRNVNEEWKIGDL